MMLWTIYFGIFGFKPPYDALDTYNLKTVFSVPFPHKFTYADNSKNTPRVTEAHTFYVGLAGISTPNIMPGALDFCFFFKIVTVSRLNESEYDSVTFGDSF